MVVRKFFSKLAAAGLLSATLCFYIALLPMVSEARDIEYDDEEISVRVSPGEPTQIKFPGIVSGGYKKKYSAISLEKKDGDLIIFASDKIDESGEAIVVRLNDGRSYSVRLQRSTPENPRDDVVRLRDARRSIIDSEEAEDPAYKQKDRNWAPATAISGFMRELILVSEFGKAQVPGYQMTDQYKGETVLHDGTVHATIDRIYIGPTLWGYVIDVKNLLDQTQKINPASFRLDGTRAISAKSWELAPRPIDIEQQIANRDSTKIYVITKAR
ncbi:MAG: type-F conjugative transfer system secretin TraK [Deltaproteobacteria bacterium]|nr:type-F conjugative transfer system secretin TraK [Deltaproteobacteria bacterium]